MQDRYFILKDFNLSEPLKQKIVNIDKERFRYYGTKRKRLYMYQLRLHKLPELSEVIDKIINPDIVDNIEIMRTEPGAIVMPHIDSERRVSLNIPIEGDFNNSYIGLFKKSLDKFIPNTEFSNGEPIIKEGGGYPASKLLEKISYTSPICLNTEKVHNVVNASTKERIVLGLGFNTKLSFKDIRNMHLKGEFVHAKYSI